MSAGPKVGVLTFHRCINYGSYWQARCLVEGIRSRGCRAELVDHDSPRVNQQEWRCGLEPVLPTPVPQRDYVLYALKMARFFRAFRRLPLSERFDLDHPDRMPAYDVVVVGSDEVWNFRHPWYGRCPLFFGEGVRSRRLASYAASFGSYDGSGGMEPRWREPLRRFDALSVRDENSRGLIRSEVGADPELVLDPALQFPVRWSGPWRGPRRPFAAVYGHNFSPAFAREVRRWADRQRLPLVSIGYRNDWADRQWITAGPHDFAQAMARAAAVATNFFHGCVFALRNARPFVCEASDYRSTKVRGLMASVGGEAHLTSAESPFEQYAARLGSPPDPQIFRRIEALRKTSAAYLDRALA